MGRRKSKLPLELIPNESSRKVTFRKRRNGLLKKAGDLKTLCDVKVCTIVYEKKSKGKLSTVATFPKEFKDVKEIIDKYKSNSSKVKRVQSLGDFYATQTVQVKKEIGKLRSKICEEKYPAWDDRFNAFSAEQMLDLLRNLENKIVAAHEMHSTMKESKQIVVQETIPPMALFQSNQKYSQMLGLSDQKPSYCSMMMNDDWTQFASTSQTNNIQYTPPVIASNSICKISAWEHDQIFNDNYISAAYGNTDENATFYNPNQKYSQMLGLSDQKPSYCSMMMNDDWTQFASTSQTNNIQYTPPVIASNSICKISAWEHDQIFNDNYISAAYGNTDENATFYNPMQQQPCMYDSIFSSAAVQQQQQQAVVPSLENPKPIDVLPLRTVLYEYDHPLSVTMQPSYLECPNSATSASSSEYDQKFAASHPQNMFYDDVFYDNLWHFE